MSTTLKRNRGSPKKTVSWKKNLVNKRNANILPNAHAYRKGLQKNNYKTNKKNNNNVPIQIMTAEEAGIIKSHRNKYVTSKKLKKTNKKSITNTPTKNIIVTNNIKERQDKFEKNIEVARN